MLEDSQKTIRQRDFLSYLDEVASVAEERLAIGLAPVLGEDTEISLEGSLVEFSELMSSLDGSLAASSEGFENSSVAMRDAASTMLSAAVRMEAAATIPTTVTVRSERSEVE
jgi:hypothetical protein